MSKIDQPVTTHPFFDNGTRQVLDSYRFVGLRTPLPFRYFLPEQAPTPELGVRWYKGAWVYGYDNLTDEGRTLFDALAKVGEQLPNGLFELFYSWQWTAEFGDLVRLQIHPDYWPRVRPLIQAAFRETYGDDIEFKDSEEILPHAA
jgi:hypothetical protein